MPCCPPGDLSNSGIKPKSLSLQVDSLLPEPPGKPKNRVSSLSFLQGIFPIQELNWGLLHCRQILNQLSYQGRGGYTHTHTHELRFTIYRAELMNLHWFNSNSKMITYFPPMGNYLGKRHTSTPQVPEGCKLVSRHHMHKHMFFVWPTNTV